MYKYLFAVLLVPSLCSADVLCANPAGKITLRTKCKKTETVVSVASLKGADGAPGANGATGATGGFTIAGCTRRDASTLSGGGLSSVQVLCGDGEFVEGYGYSADTLVSVLGVGPTFTAGVPTGALFAASASGTFNLFVYAYCCPRN